MDTEDIIVMASQARAAREKTNRTFARNSRYAEFRKFYSGGMVVFTGYLLAAIYLLMPKMSN